MRGERLEARAVLPAHPQVALSVARRTDGAGVDTVNLYGTLTQTVEIGGQRRARMAVVDAEQEVHRLYAASTEREVVAAALLVYYDALAAEQERGIVERASRTTERLDQLAARRAKLGLGTALARQLAAAAHARQREHLALAEGRRREAEARLSILVGLDPTTRSPALRGTLEPIPLPREALDELGRRAMRERPEIARARATRRVEAQRLDLRRRERIPDPSLSLFIQRDGFDERVVGGGLTIPIPLPAPLAPSGRGRLDAARSRVREAEARITAQEREIQLEVATAYHEFRSRRDAVAAHSDGTRGELEDALSRIEIELAEGRLPVREALTAHRELLDAVLRRVEAEHQLCRAAVVLALAAGLPLEGGER